MALPKPDSCTSLSVVAQRRFGGNGFFFIDIIGQNFIKRKQEKSKIATSKKQKKDHHQADEEPKQNEKEQKRPPKAIENYNSLHQIEC